jgi:hypothetical protein
MGNPVNYSNKTMNPFTKVTGAQSKPAAGCTVDNLGDGLPRGAVSGNPALKGTSIMGKNPKTPSKIC